MKFKTRNQQRKLMKSKAGSLRRVMDVENKFMVTGGGWVEGGINGEIGIDIYILLYIK